VARSFRASESRLFRTVVLPAAIPFVVAGLRLGVGRALVSVVVAELYAASAGVGFMLMLAGATFQTDRVFVGLAVLATFGLVCDLSLGMLERRLERWRPRIELG
jgi:NitT/TauT family transport system permease protein